MSRCFLPRGERRPAWHSRALAALACAAMCAGASASAPPAGWSHSLELVVGGYSAERAALANFPALVRVKEYDEGTGTGLRGFRYSDMDNPASGAEICFIDAEGNVLAHEIDTWNGGGESLVWVRLPTMEYGTEFYMCYGSATPATPSNPWGDYVGVWHLNETGSGGVAISDSTTNLLHGTAGSSALSPQYQAAPVGNGRRIYNGDSKVRQSIIVSLDSQAKLAAANSLGTDFAASMWVRCDGTLKWHYLIGRMNGDADGSWGVQSHDTDTQMRVWANNDGNKTSDRAGISGILTGFKTGWHKLDIVWKYATNGNTPSFNLYYDGALVVNSRDSTYLPVNQKNSELGIGGVIAADRGCRPFSGYMDEVRLRAGVPSADWVKAEYDTVAVTNFIVAAAQGDDGTHTVSWYLDGETLVDAVEVPEGMQPSHTNVTKAADSEHSYRHIGWSTTPGASVPQDLSALTVTSDMSLYAVWQLYSPSGWATVRWFGEDGYSPLDPHVTYFDDGELVSHAVPEKEATEKYYYTFAGWAVRKGDGTWDEGNVYDPSEDPMPAAGSTNYDFKAVYDTDIRQYDVTFLDDDGVTVLATRRCDYGTLGAALDAPVPAKPSAGGRSYIFTGWSPAVGKYVLADASYVATYAEADDLQTHAPFGFTRAAEIRVSGYDGESALTNFPVLVRINEGFPEGFDYDDCLLPSGGDIRFRLLDGTDLDYEIDTWVHGGESLVWVQLPVMTNGLKFAMYYRTSAHYAEQVPGEDRAERNIWSDYAGVWHLGERGDGEVAIRDATTNALDGTSADVSTSEADGMVGRSRRIAKDNNHARGIVIDATNGVQRAVADALGTDFSASFWICPEGGNSNDRQWSNFIGRRKGDWGRSWGTGMDDAASGIRVYYGPQVSQGTETFARSGKLYNPPAQGLGPTITNTFSAGSADVNGGDANINVQGRWSKLDVVWKSAPVTVGETECPGSWDIYLNGVLASSGPLPACVSSELANIGIGCSTQDQYKDAPHGSATEGQLKGRRFNGEMDEVRIRKTVPSADWIKADHDTVRNAGFLSSTAAAGLPEMPELADVGVWELGDTYAVVTGRVLFVGQPATTATVRLMVGESADALAEVASGTFGYGPFSLVASNLAAATEYRFALDETDGSSNCFTTGTNSFTTLAAPAGTVNLAFDLPPHVSVASVTVRGEPVEPDEGGAYPVPPGLPVTVAFAAAEGYVLTGAARELRVTLEEDTELSGAETIPVAMHFSEAIVINEVMASNGKTLISDNGGKEMDWVELHNRSDEDIDVFGWYLSDKSSNLAKGFVTNRAGRVVVPANGYRIVWFDSSYADWSDDEAHVPVSLSASGESVYLSLPPAAATNDIIDQVSFEAQVKNVSYGRGEYSFDGDSGLPDGFVYFREPTPGGPNQSLVAAPGEEARLLPEGYGLFTPKVEYSRPHGYYSEPFELVLSNATATAAPIYYTLDGRKPTTSDILYTNAIPIAGTTFIRAAVPSEGAILQLDTSSTYIFLDEVLSERRSTSPSGAAAANGFPASKAVNGHAMLYGLRGDIADSEDAETVRRLRCGFTNTIATVSIVTDPANLFNSDDGIYVNPQGDGRTWERESMLEIFSPTNAAKSLNIPAGLRIRGGSSRSKDKAKHSFRFLFRSEYGKSQLEDKTGILFDGECGAATKYDKLDLRTSQNLSWSNEGGTKDTFIHEVFSRDSQRDMGQPYTRSRYYNLFLNGVYWGLYQTQERGDEHFAESYLGGDSLQYDLIKTSSSHAGGTLVYENNANEGTIDAWSNLWHVAVNEGFGPDRPNNYNYVRGLDEAGVRDPMRQAYLNVTNLAAYMITAHYTVDADGPTSPRSKNGHPNNLYALRNRDDGTGNTDGFVFLRHDAELSFGFASGTSVRSDPTTWGTEGIVMADTPPNDGKTYTGDSYRDLAYFTPAELHWRLCEGEYTNTFADCYYRFVLRPGAPMSVEKCTERFQRRMDEIDCAVVGEAARWAQAGQAYGTWKSACRECLAFITNRTTYLTEQYIERGWYPGVEVPLVCADAGGAVPLMEGCEIDEDANGQYKVYLWITNTFGGKIYYTLDGADPRGTAGAPYGWTSDGAGGFTRTAADAAVQTNCTSGGACVVLPPTQGYWTIRARARRDSDGVWSALEELKVGLNLPSDQRLGVRIAAVMSAPPNDPDCEYIVLTNLLDRAVSLDGMKICSWNMDGTTRKKQSLELTISNGVAIGPNGVVTLERTSYLECAVSYDAKDPRPLIKNSQVEIELDDFNGKIVQVVYLDHDWWESAEWGTMEKPKGPCDKAGAYFVALKFNGKVDPLDGLWPVEPDANGRDLSTAVSAHGAGDGDWDYEFPKSGGAMFAVWSATGGEGSGVLSQPFVVGDGEGYSKWAEASATLGQWLGAGEIATNAASKAVLAAGSPIPGAADATSVHCAGEVVCTNTAHAAARFAKVDCLLDFPGKSDGLGDADALAGAQIALCTGTNYVGGTKVPIHAWCRPKDGSGDAAWAEVGSAATGAWTRVTLLHDYASGLCKICLDGIPAASAGGYLTTNRSWQAATPGAWYEFAAPVADPAPSAAYALALRLSGDACIDDVSVSQSDALSFGDAVASVTIGDGVATNVSRALLAKWGVAPGTVADARLDASGLSVSDKLEAGLDPEDGSCLELTGLGMGVSAASVTLSFNDAAPAEWHRFVLGDANAPGTFYEVRALRKKRKEEDGFVWGVFAEGGEEPVEEGLAVSFADGEGARSASVTLPAALSSARSLTARLKIVAANDLPVEDDE